MDLRQMPQNITPKHDERGRFVPLTDDERAQRHRYRQVRKLEVKRQAALDLLRDGIAEFECAGRILKSLRG